MQPLLFIGYWATNSILIWIVGQISPENIVLGNQHVSPIQASIFAGYILATINSLVEPTVKWLKIKQKKPLQQVIVLIVVNSASIWAITKLALIVGVGIIAFWWAIILGIIVMLGQLIIQESIAKQNKSE